MAKIPPLTIAPIIEKDHKVECAKLMCESEPWITLKRNYSDCLSVISDPEQEIYGAFNGKKELLGFAVLNMHGAFKGYIQSILINPLFRDQGLGTRLLNFCEERILKESPNVFICVSSFNKKAAKLYDRLGYKKVGELDNYIIAGYSEILLRKTISPISEFIQKNNGMPTEHNFEKLTRK